MDLGENENENETQEYIRISNKEKMKENEEEEFGIVGMFRSIQNAEGGGELGEC